MSARHILLEGGPPWGFRMTGGADVGAPLRVSRVNPGSKAAFGGVREGDFISAINSQSTKNLGNSEAQSLLKNSGQILSLSLNEATSGSPKRRIQFPGKTGGTGSRSEKSSNEALNVVGYNMISPAFKAVAPRPGVWSPAQSATNQDRNSEIKEENQERKKIDDEPIPPIWTPKSAQASPVFERKEFRPVNFESPTLPRKNNQERKQAGPVSPPWQQSDDKPIEVNFSNSLPKAQNPTVTLLQKAREGRIPRGAHYLNQSEMPEQDQNEYELNGVYFPIKHESSPHRIELGVRRPVDGIGPTTREGIPLVLRSEVRDENKEKWYKRMYDSLHKTKEDSDFVTVKYRTSPHRRGQSSLRSGYTSEPETTRTEESRSSYQTLDRRRSEKNKENEVISVTLPRANSLTRYGAELYKNQPGKIENYQPGHSSITDLEANKWWDEVLEIFDRWLDANPGADGRDARRILADAIIRKQAKECRPVHKTHSPKSFMTYALKESGYESEPQHIYTRRDDSVQTPLSPQEQKEAYIAIQKGGEVPLRGLRKPAPERPKENTEIEYFPLSPTLTRIRVHKQNITPLSELCPFVLNYPPVPFGVCSSFSDLYACPKPSSLKAVTNSQVADEYTERIKPKPRKLPKTAPVYENLPYTKVSNKITFGQLKRTAPSSLDNKKRKLDKPITSKIKSRIPLSESRLRERPLARKKTCEEAIKMHTIYDSRNPNFNARSTSAPPKPPSRKSSKNNSTLRLWSKMRINYPQHCSRIDVFDSNVKFLQNCLRRKLHPSKAAEFGDDVETVRTVHRNKNGDMSIKTNRYIKISRPTSLSPVATAATTRPVYDQNGRRVRSEPRKLETIFSDSSTSSNKKNDIGKKADTIVKSSTSYSLRKNTSQEDKGKSVKVTVAISSTQKDSSKKTSTSVKRSAGAKDSRSPSVSSLRSSRSTASSVQQNSPNILSPNSSTSRISSPSTPSSPAYEKQVKKDMTKLEEVTFMPTSKSTSKKINNKTLVKRTEKVELQTQPPKDDDLIKSEKQVRTDSFFQHLFLRSEPLQPEAPDKSSSLNERVRRYQRSAERAVIPKSPQEASLGMLQLYLTQKRPVSCSRFKSMDREMSKSRSPSPYERRNRRLVEQFGDFPSQKFRSVSEPPLKLLCDDQKMPEKNLTLHAKVDCRGSRARSAGEVEGSRRIEKRRDDLQYSPAYLSDAHLHHSSKNCDRFRELHKFYESLERLAELEKTTLSSDFKPRLRNEEIIDFDRWKEVRSKERAEEEMKAIVGKLTQIQREKDLLFRTCDVEALRWKGDRGLRVKERSVEDLRNKFTRMSEMEEKRNIIPKDNYKPLWRGCSIIDLASNLNTTAASHRGRPVTLGDLKNIESSKDRVIRFGKSRMWSSLSKSEVSDLKSQLTEIYKQELQKKGLVDYEGNCEIEVLSCSKPQDLTIRSNSLMNSNETLTSTLEKKGGNTRKAKSVSGAPASSDFPLKKEEREVLSEKDKKKISMTLSREVLEKMSQSKSIIPRETLGAVVASRYSRQSPDHSVTSPRTCYSLDLSEDGKTKSDFLWVLTPTDKDVLAGPKEQKNNNSAATELESTSVSSETSVNTVIKKIEYFDDLGKKLSLQKSYSNENIKELLGERSKDDDGIDMSSVKNVNATKRFFEELKSQSPFKSSDSLFSYRSRSFSPDPTKYYRAYLEMKDGNLVRNICSKFESLEDLMCEPYDLSQRRSISDPELARNLFKKVENNPKNRKKAKSPVQRAPFSMSDRFMPKINVISKIAELQSLHLYQKEKDLLSSEATSLNDDYFPRGEVEKLRQKFECHQDEKVSLIGRMYTSSPDINELRSISPYLGCTWIAHQNPSVTKTQECKKAVKLKPRPHSSSPPRSKNLTSILKSSHSDIFANQKFDPTIHQPKFRYQPPFEEYHDYRPSVKFQGINFRSDLPFPEEILDSPRKYVESEVTIHYKTPIRNEAKEPLSEEELTRRQAEAMKRIYQEERRRKYLMELQDMSNRRHTDYFTPSQKSPIPLNRYDNFDLCDLSPNYRERTPEPRLHARALFKFVGQSPRELSFNRGDVIHVRRQIDRNWYEGELNSRIGLFPVNYVEIVPFEGMRTTPNKPQEGQARAKYNFVAKSSVELSLVKGELVVLTRRVDANWYEGRVGARTGIFPVSYVEVLIPPGRPSVNKPIASPAAHSLLYNGTASQLSMGAHHYSPLGGLSVDTSTGSGELYRVLYSYKPVNSDELELIEGDTVVVMEKCDDGWYVGSSQKSGQFGTFPGNYVKRI